MTGSASRQRRQWGRVRVGLAAASVIAAAAALGLFFLSGEPMAASGAGAAPEQVGTDNGSSGKPPVTARRPRASSAPVARSVPYDYRDFGSEMFALEPRPASMSGAGPYPAPVRMNRAAAERAAVGGAMDVTLPDGSRYPISFERAETGARGNWTWVGRVETPAGALAAVLTYGRDGVFGVLPTPEGELLQVQTRDGRTYLQPDPGLVPPGVDPANPIPDYVVPRLDPHQQARASGGPTAAAASTGPTSFAGEQPPSGAARGATTGGMVPTAGDQATQIDVLGVYTTNLVEERGSVSAAETEFINLLEISNQAHVDSGTSARFKLVGMVETDFPASAYNDAVLYALQGNSLPDGLDIHAERDAHGADLVALLRPYAPNDFSCGIAYLSGGGLGGTNAHDGFGYSVTACGAYTMAHELGHNLGSHHDRETASANGILEYGAFEYSFGHRHGGSPKFATIMAYQASWDQPRVGYFSAPENLSCEGLPCGVAGESDNVRSINMMAETISRFRDPPNTISVMDARVIEPYSGYSTLSFKVRLSSPAPAGGVRFDIATVDGGTATAGADYTSKNLTGRVIPEGEREWWFDVDVLPDRQIEGDEHVLVRLSNVEGMEIYDEEGLGLILDDDPRVKVSGKLLVPEGTERPDGITIFANVEYLGQWESQYYFATRPLHEYEFEVPSGSRVILDAYVNTDSPWVNSTLDIGKVERDGTHDLLLERAVWISGRVRWPKGSTPTGESMWVEGHGLTGHWSSWDGMRVSAPDYAYRFKAHPGAAVGIYVSDPPAPYVAQRVETHLLEDTVLDVLLAQTPSLSIRHESVTEGAGDDLTAVNLRIQLSTAAPEEGVSFDLVTVPGTATANQDFYEERMAISIPAGATETWATLYVLGDDHHESDEYFSIEARNIRGAHMPSKGVVRILDDDPKPAVNDFDANGRSDLVWRHTKTGRNVLWDGAQYGRAKNLVTVRGLEWEIVGTGDFDRDGKSDLLWRHATEGRNTIWRAGDYSKQLGVARVANLAWEVAGVGDFDGDGQSDVLWRNRKNGANTIWRGADSKAERHVTNVTDLHWHIVGVGDFDGDGHSDILWRHARSGANTIWLQGNYGLQQRMTGVTNTSWMVAGAGDFDADGVDDVLWRNRRTGASAIWYGADYGRYKALTTVTDLRWEIVAVGDYDGDGRADIAWRNRATGANVVWRAGEFRDQIKVTGVTDTGWGVLN